MATKDILEKRIKELEKENNELKKQLTLPSAITLSNYGELDAVFNLNIDGIVIANKEGFFLKVNKAFVDMLGYTEEKILQTPILDFLHPEDIGITKTVLADSFNPGYSGRNFENRYLTKSGAIKWLSWNYISNGETIYTIVRDVTEQKKNNELLELFKSIFEYSKEALSIVALSDNQEFEKEKVLYINPAFTTMFGYTYEEMKKQSISVLYEQSKTSQTRFKQIVNMVKNRETVSEEVIQLKKDGTHILVKLNLIPIINTSFNKNYVLAFRQDITEQHQQKVIHEENTFQHKLLVDNMNDAVLMLDSELNIIFVTPSIEKLTGRGADYFIRRNLLKIFPKAINDDFQTFIQSHQVRLSKETHLYQKNLTRIDVKVNLQKVATSTNSPVKFILDIQDISEEVKSRESILSKQELLNKVGKLTHTGGWELDPKTQIVSWTEEVFFIHDMNKNESEPSIKDAIDFYIKEHRPIIRSAVNRAVQQGIPFDLILSIETAKGRLKHVHVVGEAIKGNHGEVSKVIGAIQDITEKKMEEDYRRMLESVAVNVKDAVLITAAEGVDSPHPKIVYANKAFTELTGYSLDEIMGKTPRILQGKDTSREARQQIREALNDWKPINITVKNYKKDGTPFWVNLDIVPIADPTGWYTHWVSTQRDVTKEITYKKTLEEMVAERTQELKITNEKLEQFARVASHDMKTPLRSISAFLGLLKRSAGERLKEKELNFLENAQQGAEEMSELIDAILKYSRISSRAVFEDAEELDLNELLDVTIERYFQNQMQETNARISHAALPKITANPFLIMQLFQNFIGNALKFCREGETPQIAISSYDDDLFHYFEIQDNGIGIADKYKNKIFEPFKRLNDMNKYKGHGIGLSVCKEIVEAYEGKVSVESVVNQGSTFKFSIKKWEYLSKKKVIKISQ